MPRSTQLNVNGGELTPKVHARKDLGKRQNGAKLLNNMFVLSYGGASNRGGLRFAAEVKDSDVDINLERFAIAGDEALAVEVGPTYFRYLFEGGVLMDNGVPVETVTPYSESQVETVNFAQSNDEATLVDVGSPVHDLVRISANNFTLTQSTFQPLSVAPASVSVTTTQGYAEVPPGSLKEQHEYAVSTISETGEESLLSPKSTGGTAVILGYNANSNNLTWPLVSNAIEYSIYKRTVGQEYWGFIGRSTNGRFKDTGIAPSTAQGPQQGNNPFNAVGDYPKVASFVQQRRVFASTTNKAQTFNMTQSANFKNFNTSIPSQDDDAVEFTLAAEKKQDINHIVSLEKGMIVFTRTGEWRITGQESAPISPSSISAQPQSYWGSAEALKPLIVGEKLMFVTQGMKVRDLEYSISIDRYRSVDLSLLSEHLFIGRTIVSWDYCAEPYGIVYCVLDDGTCLTCTFLTEHEVWGWSRMETSGKIKRVKSIPEAGEDVPYFIVERRINGVTRKYIEYLKDREFDDIRDAFFVDSGLSYDVPLKVSEIGYGADTTLTITAHGLAVNDEIELDKVHIEDSFYKTLKDIDGRYLVSAVVSDDVVRIKSLKGESIITTDYTTKFYSGNGIARKAVSTVSGLEHLEGMDVSCLCDGGVVENKMVVNGSINFTRRYARVHTGLAYSCELETLDTINRQDNDDGVFKTAGRSYVRLYQTRGVEWGLNFDEMTPVESRNYEDYGTPNKLMDGLFEIILLDDYDREVTFCARQTQPLPFTFLEVVQQFEYGE